MVKRKLSVMECDAPGCWVTRPVRPEDGKPEGVYLGRGSFIHSGGGIGLREIYACSLEHVQPAVNYVVEEAQEGWKH